MKLELQQYAVEPGAFWQALPAELRGPYWSRQAEACPCSACVADQQSMQKEVQS